MDPSLNKAPIPATGGLHTPLKFAVVAQELLLSLVISCEGFCVLPLVSLAKWLCRSALGSRLMAARRRPRRRHKHSPTLLSICRSGLLPECLLHMTRDGLEQMQLPTVAFQCFVQRLCPTRIDAQAFQLFIKRVLLKWQRTPYSQLPISDLQA